MSKRFSGFAWLMPSLCVSLVFGLPSCSFQNTTIVSHLDLLVQEDVFIRRNIGLVGGTPTVQDDITLDDFSDPTSHRGIFFQMFQGAWEGALSGLETGQLFCWGGSGHGRSTLHISGHSGGADALIFLILCGGGMVTGMGIGAAVGMVTPLLTSQDPTEIPIARKHVIQGIWKGLTGTSNQESAPLHRADDAASETVIRNAVSFGSHAQPFTAFMRFERIRVGLFPQSYFTAGELTLVWNIQVAFFDHRWRMLAKHSLEMEQGEYSFGKWADQDASFLKEKLQEGYGLIADQIVRKLTIS